MKKLLQVIAISVFALVLVGCNASNTANQEPETAETSLTVATSFYPLYYLASSIVGDSDSVFSVIPAGAEPHSYEPTPQDLVKVYSADVFIYNGAEMDPWAERIAPELTSRGVQVIELAQFVDLLKSLEDDHDQDNDHHHDNHHDDHHHDDDYHHNDHHDDDHHDHGQYDPHFWLDPIIMISLANEIEQILSQLDPENADIFASNLQIFTAQLQEIDSAYQARLSSCEIRDAVASHAAFQYLASRYGFNVVSISGISPESEPSPARLAEISRHVQDKGINYIFFEALISPRVAETIARETGAQTLVFNPIEGLTQQDIAAEKDYISLMYDNLDTLTTALNCS